MSRWKKEKELNEMLLKLNEIKSAEKRGFYKDLLTKWHRKEFNRERSHNRKRDFRPMEKAKELIWSIPSSILRYRRGSLEDMIFSKNPEELHELVTDDILSEIIESLSSPQKKALHCKVMLKYKTSDVAEIMGISPRAVHKHYTTALFHIRGKLYSVVKLKRKLETDEKYRQAMIDKGIGTTDKERKFLETADAEVKNYYGATTKQE